eukprot:TRINITY_DN2698_c0_g1_i1.p1 TRINITY_DN2698_c0_g1~~TRINITY_DN2698_c0_g1_i1.p1  ORF type:complete len:403 (-),score=126.07 TRINITY_DN2698_c0_g1_i1:111-1232(-)
MASASLLSSRAPFAAALVPRACASLSNNQRREFSVQLAPGGVRSRSSVSGIIATVFGSTGFLGRYVVSRLGRIGSQVIVPNRGDDLATRHLKVCGDLGQIVPLPYVVQSDDDIRTCVERSNLVINLIGAPWPTKNYTITDANRHVPARIAKIAHECGVENMIHVSALGATPDSPSEFARSKYEGEQEVLANFPGAVIVRPGPIFGFEDRFLNRIGVIARHWPFMPLTNPDHRMQPIHMSDVVSSIMAIADNLFDVTGARQVHGKTFEVGGPDVLTQRELSEEVIKETLLNRHMVPIPHSISLPIAKVTQFFRRPRFVYDEIIFEGANDRVVSSEPDTLTVDNLGVSPVSVLEYMKRYVRDYRKPIYLNMIVDK